MRIAIEDVYYCLESPSHKIFNTLREDNNPSLGFLYKYRNKRYILTVKDFAYNHYDGDIFHIVGIVLNKPCNNPKNFVLICNHIIESLWKNNTLDFTLLKEDKLKYLKNRDIDDISVYKRDFNNKDFTYWKQYNFDIDTLNNNYIFAVSSAYYNDNLIYTYRSTDPCYAYYLGKKDSKAIWQLYYPLRAKGKIKFITNNRQSLLSTFNLKLNSDVLVLCKSRKDEILTKQLVDKYLGEPYIFISYGDYRNISYSSFASESAILSKELMQALYKIAPIIITITDFDRQGKACGYYHKKHYNTIPLYLTKKYKHKDITDYYKEEGEEKSMELVDETFKYLFKKLNYAQTSKE